MLRTLPLPTLPVLLFLMELVTLNDDLCLTPLRFFVSSCYYYYCRALLLQQQLPLSAMMFRALLVLQQQLP